MARLGEHYREHGERMAEILAARSAAELQVIADFFAEVNDPGQGPAVRPAPGPGPITRT